MIPNKAEIPTRTLPLSPEVREFREKFLRELEDSGYGQDPMISRILKDPALADRCASLCWNYASADHLVEASKDYVGKRKILLETAIAGVEAAIIWFGDREPGHVQQLKLILADLLKEQSRASFPLPRKQLGRDRDWSAVLEIKEQLIRGTVLADSTLAALLSAADFVSGLSGNGEPVEPQSVREGLERLQERLRGLQ